MTTQEKKGLQLILRTTPHNADYGKDDQAASKAALYWIVRQITLDERRRGPRGKYNRR